MFLAAAAVNQAAAVLLLVPAAHPVRHSFAATHPKLLLPKPKNAKVAAIQDAIVSAITIPSGSRDDCIVQSSIQQTVHVTFRCVRWRAHFPQRFSRPWRVRY